ncbi:hypothetical protein BN8_02601 [Fibrisoma limi BUZ 3]|uniref:SPOR domain-containing protein n=1 Tax=Fibrisoma limi BUZ 3 TaxID=1185876 RepID=I2GHX7_9BACT|nr:SPOR domain-containing protein [Fibrisoma limi]CCH53502.1 hypothetical protein BN8_02601 [Fibrisoma limi BUZ 3]
MATVNEYLKKLLYQYDCIVVPELGAFLTHYQSASFTESQGVYLPPRKRLAFNEALRLDDGILMNYLMLHEQLNREDAQRRISSFVADLRREVQQTGRFEIEGVGTFTRNEEDRLQFDPNLRHNFHGESYGLTSVSAQVIGHQAEPAAIEAVPVTALGPVLHEDVVEETALMPLQRPRSYWRVAAAVLLVGSLGAVSYLSVLKPGQPLQSSLNPANLLTSVPAVFQSAEETAKPASAAPRYVAKPVETAPTTTVETPAPPVAEPVPAPVAPTKTNVVETPVTPAEPVAVAAPVAKPKRIGPHFTVIAGSFSSKRNAQRFQRWLRRKGYEDAYIIVPAQKGQLYKVAAAGSEIRSEAVASLGVISDLTGAQAWILKN